MTERSIFNTILSAELARFHEETLAAWQEFERVDQPGLGALETAMTRLAGLLPDDMRPKGIKPTPFRTHIPKKKSADDLL